MPFICQSTKSCPITDAWSRAPSTGPLGGPGTTSSELRGAAFTTGNAKIELNIPDLSLSTCFCVEAVPETFQGVFSLAGQDELRAVCYSEREGETRAEDSRGPSSSPLARVLSCLRPSLPPGHTQALQVWSRAFSPDLLTQTEVLEQRREENCRSWGKAFKRYPHCVKRVCQSIFVSAVEVHFLLGRVHE